MTKIRFITALLGAAALAACSKDGIQDITAPTAGAFIKFYNFGVNGVSVNFFANDMKVTAVSSTSCSPPSIPANPACTAAGIESTTGTAYGAVASGGFYSSIAPGQYTFAGKVALATDNGLTVAKLSSTLADGKYYSFYMSGIYDATAKSTDAFIIEDAFPADIDFVNSYVKFVNASSNSSPMTVYAKNTVTGDSVVIGSAVVYKNGSAFVKVPGAVYDLTVRYSGSNTAVIVGAGVSLSNARVYTVTARGDMTITSTTSANRPLLTASTNR
jgi:hypothetical protein